MSYKSPKWNNGSAPPLSAENMQALTDAVQEHGEALAAMCNPNLLDNWYFGKPVNQRGASGTISAAGYFFDRWKLVSGSVTINSGGIVLNGTIAQVLEYAAGQTVTATVLTPDGVTDVTPVYDDETKTFTVTAQGKTIRAVKLELGSQQTLAHQENGVWVLNEIPKLGDQLAACQRYLIPINNWTRVRASYYSGTALFFAVPIPSTMRTTPAILDPSGALTVQSVSGTDQTGFTFECNMSTPGSIGVGAMKNSHGLTDGQLVKRGGGNFQTAFFSSEL